MKVFQYYWSIQNHNLLPQENQVRPQRSISTLPSTVWRQNVLGLLWGGVGALLRHYRGSHLLDTWLYTWDFLLPAKAHTRNSTMNKLQVSCTVCVCHTTYQGWKWTCRWGHRDTNNLCHKTSGWHKSQWYHVPLTVNQSIFRDTEITIFGLWWSRIICRSSNSLWKWH